MQSFECTTTSLRSIGQSPSLRSRLGSNSSRGRAGTFSCIEAADENDDVDEPTLVPLPEGLDSLPEGQEEAIMKVASAGGRAKQRSYGLDWMRIIAIYLVVLFHCCQALDWAKVWTVPNILIPHVFMATGYQVGMQLFFHLSGRAQAMSPPKRVIQCIQKRVLRLLIPFFVAFVLLIPPWLCIGDCKGKGNVFSFYIYYFFQGGIAEDFNMGWLWFLPALFIITLMCLPAMNYMETKSKIAVVWGVLEIIVVLVLFRKLGYSWVFCIVSPVPLIAGVALNSYIPFPAAGESNPSPQRIISCWIVLRVNTFLFVLASCILVASFRYEGESSPQQTHLIPGFMVFLYVYMQGYMTQRWRSGCAPYIETDICGCMEIERMKKYVGMWEVLVGFGLLAILFSSHPVNTSSPPFWEANTVPIYSSSFLDDPTIAVVSMLGTWGWLGLALCMCQAYVEKEIDEFLYTHASASTTIVYIFHWMFIRMFAEWIVIPWGLTTGAWRFLDVPLTFSVAVGGSLGVYWLCIRVPWLGVAFGV